MKYLLAFSFLITCVFSAVAQNENLNNFKYIIVDNQYEFQGEANEYRFNELIVFEFKKRNFTAFRNSEVLPTDINQGECNSLRVTIEKSGTLRVNMVLSLIDCVGQTVFTTKKGVGKTKSNDKAYFEAVRDAMSSFDEVDYKYVKPYYTAVAPNSESVVDSVLTMFGQPGNYKSNGKDAQKENKDTENVVEQSVPKFNEKVNDTQPLDATQQTVKKDFFSKDKAYSLVKTEEGFLIYKGKDSIGNLKKSKNGSYLAITTEFVGIAYDTSKGISIEYSLNGKDFIMELVKE